LLEERKHIYYLKSFNCGFFSCFSFGFPFYYLQQTAAVSLSQLYYDKLHLA
jgi:hypothetical protein